MKVVNVHQRLLHASPERVGALIATLASSVDALWPRRDWPRIAFDRPLGVGARGGHGPIRYDVDAYVPGESIRFRFTGPRGFDGWHKLEVLEATLQHSVLEHRIQMETSGTGTWLWLLVVRPLHDALIEDAFAVAEASLGLPARRVPWSPYVRLLRWLAQRPWPHFFWRKHPHAS
jgi:hypothetical protein